MYVLKNYTSIMILLKFPFNDCIFINFRIFPMERLIHYYIFLICICLLSKFLGKQRKPSALNVEQRNEKLVNNYIDAIIEHRFDAMNVMFF